MQNSIKRVALLTSGGDAPGMNSAIRAFVRFALDQNLEVFSVEQGYNGLVAGRISQLNRRSVSDILQRGGTILKTARSEEFKAPDGQQSAYNNLVQRGIGGLCVIGGDGSFSGALSFSTRYSDIKMACIPATIDNDLAYTDFSLGFDTAVNTVLDAINKLRDTMDSHERTCIVEVMGRSCGDIALYSGVGGGAEAILVPEIPYDVKKLAAMLMQSVKKGKSSDIIILAEGAGKAQELAIVLQSLTKIQIRYIVLGHIQRGGSPTSADRTLGARFGAEAVRSLLAGENCAIGVRCGQIVRENLAAALKMKKQPDLELFKLAEILAK